MGIVTVVADFVEAINLAYVVAVGRESKFLIGR